MSYIDKMFRDMPGRVKTKPGIYHNVVEHDDNCSHFKGKECNCDATVSFYSDEEYIKKFPDSPYAKGRKA